MLINIIYTSIFKILILAPLEPIQHFYFYLCIYEKKKLKLDFENFFFTCAMIHHFVPNFKILFQRKYILDFGD